MQQENTRRNFPPLSPDQDATASGYVGELTQTNSHSSAITADCSKDASSLHSGYSAQGPATVWTDEKHSLYLDSLEASFVNQLHNSIALRGCLQKILWNTYSSQAAPSNSCDSPHQFTALQDGSWQKINPKRHKPVFKSTAGSHFIQENPCTGSSVKRSFEAHHDQEHSVASSERLHARENFNFCLPRSLRQYSSSRLCHHNSSGVAIEVSDQNFVDESQGEKSNHRVTAKRFKRNVSDASGSDQIVPCGIPNASGVSAVSGASSVGEKQGNQELWAEDLDDFVYPKSESLFLKRELSRL